MKRTTTLIISLSLFSMVSAENFTIDGYIRSDQQFVLGAGGIDGYWTQDGRIYGPADSILQIRTGNGSNSLRLGGSHNSDHLTILPNGNTGIGTVDPKYRLSVAGGRFNVEANGDYYGFWVDNKAKEDNPQVNVGEWYNSRGSMLYDSTGNFLSFETQYGADTYPNTIVMKGGKVGIGTTNLQQAFNVNGTIRAKEVIVDTGWSDYVFEPTYRLRPLAEVESHIADHGHLPDVPSASVVESNGLSVGDAQKIMMQKIEELTLYMIEQDKRNSELEKKVEELESRLSHRVAQSDF